MSRLRIEGLLAAFPKLIASDERTSTKQHTFIETEEVRYIYQPMDTLYLLLITNMQSNILEDLSTLRMIAKLIPEYCGGHDEETVSENAFNLLYALDEVVTPMGYKESVTYKQIEDFVKMDSAEEKLSEIIEKSKRENAAEVMKKKAAEFDKKRAEERKKHGSPLGYKGLDALSSLKSKFGGGSGSGSMDNVNAISSETYNQQFGDDGHEVVIEQHNKSSRGKYGGDNSDDSDHGGSSYKKKKKKKQRPMGGMSLSKRQKEDNISKEQKEFDKKAYDNNIFRGLLESAKSGGSDGDDLIDASDLSPIEIFISEKLYVTFDRDGAMKKMEIKGDMEVAVNDPGSTQCVIETNINPSKKLKFGKPTWRLHPRMNSSEWKKGILCLKDAQKQFRVGRSSKTSILKWRMTTNDDNNVPISIEFWPEAESDGTVIVNAKYMTNIALKNVIITFPTQTNQEPDIADCTNGDTAFYRNDGEFQWILNDLDGDNEGSLEYTVEDVQLEDLWPISVHFEIENTYSQIQIISAHDVDGEEQYEYNVKGTCVAEKYIIES